jgi:hypothetical protein
MLKKEWLIKNHSFLFIRWFFMNLKNKKNHIIPFIIFFTLNNILGCEVNKVSFIENKIQDLKSKTVYNPPASVWKWVHKGVTYYYITSDCCDQYSDLYDMSGKLICHPDGGMTGKGDGKCTFDAFSVNSLVEKSLIWKDDRK